MRDPAIAHQAAQQLRESAVPLTAAVYTLVRGGAPQPVVAHLQAAVASVENTARLLEQI